MPNRTVISPKFLKALGQKAAAAKNETFKRLRHNGQPSRRSSGLSQKGGSGQGMIRLVYVSKRGLGLPGKLIRQEGKPPRKDPEINRLYDFMGQIWSFLNTEFSLNSLDNQGIPLSVTVDYSGLRSDAEWDCAARQAVIGIIGQERSHVKSLTQDVDILAHEFGHGLVQATGGVFAYYGQSGAIEESFADVIAISVKQHMARSMKLPVNPWMVGENYFHSHNGSAIALRSFTTAQAYSISVNNGDGSNTVLTDQQPKFYLSEYDNTSHPLVEKAKTDYVHLFCGIPNHAYYLAHSKIGTLALKVWFEALKNRAILTKNPTFALLKAATINAAEALCGPNSKQTADVRDAWSEVGL